MRFHYVPSTYRGRKFGKGFCGGAYRGCARICGGSLDDNEEDTPGPVAVPVNIPVQPAQIQQNLLDFPNITPEMIERARNIIALAEATGKAQPITKKEAGIWSGIKNIGSKIWSGAKAVASNPLVQTAASIAAPYLIGAVAPTLASYVPKALDNVGRYAYNKLDPIYHQEAIKDNSALGNLKEIGSNAGELLTKGAEQIIAAPAAIANAAISAPAKVLGWQAQLANAGANAVKNVFSNAWNRWRGRGYRGGRRARLRKGSPEAKAYMARLRAMRGKKKRSGSGYRAGMLPNFRGSGYRGGMFRGVTYNELLKLADDAEANGKNFAVVNWKDTNGNDRTTKVSVANIDKMLKATDTIADFYDDKNRSEYLKANYGKKAWPYANLTEKRYKTMMKKFTTQKNYKKLQDYWRKRTKGYDWMIKKWMTYNVDEDDKAKKNPYHKSYGRKIDRERRDAISTAKNDMLEERGEIDANFLERMFDPYTNDVEKVIRRLKRKINKLDDKVLAENLLTRLDAIKNAGINNLKAKLREGKREEGQRIEEMLYKQLETMEKSIK